MTTPNPESSGLREDALRAPLPAWTALGAMLVRILVVAVLETAGMVGATTALVLDRASFLPATSGASGDDLWQWGALAALGASVVVSLATPPSLWPLWKHVRRGTAWVLSNDAVIDVGRRLGPTVASIGVLSYVVAAAAWVALAWGHGVPARVWAMPACFAVAAGVLLNAYGTVLRFDTHVLAHEYSTGCATVPARWNRLVRWLYMGGSSAGPTRDAHARRLPWGSTPPELVLLAVPCAAAALAHASLGKSGVLHAIFASFVAMFVVSIVNDRTLLSVDALHWIRAVSQDAPVAGHGTVSDTRRSLRGRGAGWWRVDELFEVMSQSLTRRLRDPRILMRGQSHDLGRYLIHALEEVEDAAERYPDAELEVAGAAVNAAAWVAKGHGALADGHVGKASTRLANVPRLAGYLVTQARGAVLSTVDVAGHDDRGYCQGLFAVVLHNLLANAATATPVGGGRPRVSVRVAEGVLRLEVENEGPGFGAPGGFERACELFYSGTGSTGYGLYHCRQAEERLWGGAVLSTRRRFAATQVDARTRVVFEFPLYNNAD